MKIEIKANTLKIGLGLGAYALVDHGVNTIIKESIGDTSHHSLVTKLSIFMAKATISSMAAEYAYHKISKRNFNDDVDKAMNVLEEEVKSMKAKYDIV
jgi:hypothetical protein|nr:MAG TPA: hypothetical protein [Caudoviricetes sp.]